jgi:hypothetical protein
MRLCPLLIGLVFAGASSAPSSTHARPEVDPLDLLSRAPAPEVLGAHLKRFAPAEIAVDPEKIPAVLAVLLPHLVKASNHIDTVFWDQVSPEGRLMHEALSQSKAPGAESLATLMALHYGPWDRFANDRPLIAGIPRPAGANLYPADMSRGELDAWLAKNPDAAESVKSPYTVIRRKAGTLTAVPYSQAWLEPLKHAADALRKAAGAYVCSPAKRKSGGCECDGLARFLQSRADAMLNDDYRASELDWVQSKSCPLDIAIGPYEFYEDRLLGQKAAFESIITYRDDAASKRFAALAALAPTLVQNLPVSEGVLSRLQPVPQAAISIADLLYTAGDARAGYQMRAYLLPNDEEVRVTQGQKHVILRNVVRAKFDALVQPLAARVLEVKTLAHLSFDAYFDILLAWQLSHSVVAGPIALPDGTTTSSRQQLRERYTIIEGVKGEALSLWNYLQLADQGHINDKGGEKLAATYLASLFDAARQATDSPQAIARTIVFNFLSSEWVLRYHPMSQTFEVHPPALREATRKLAAEALDILARGDYHGAGRLIVQHGIMSGEVRQKLAALSDLPLEIMPSYKNAGRAAGRSSALSP